MPHIPEIDIHEAKKRLDAEDATFLDMRDPQSYQAAHIPGAAPLRDDTLEGVLADADRERTTIVYCYHGNMSRNGAAYLIENGFEDVCSLSGGFELWRSAYDTVPSDT